MINRRQLLATLGLGTAVIAPEARAGAARPATVAHERSPSTRTAPPIRAIAFDGLALFDPRPVLAEMAGTFGAAGPEFVRHFQSRQFEYTWLRTLTDSYADFRTVTGDAIRFARRTMGVELADSLRERWQDAFAALDPWPDVAATVDALAARGLPLAVLSNFTPSMLSALTQRAQLPPMALLSVDAVRAYKPDPRAYALATRQFHCTAAEIAFVAFAGWDAAGAKRFGMRTYWANRLGSATELLGATADAAGPDFGGVLEFAST